jgi:hypothetical protein
MTKKYMSKKYMSKKYMSKKYMSKQRRKTRKYRKYGGTPLRLENRKNKVASILSRVKANQDQSRLNTQKMYDYIKRLDNTDDKHEKITLVKLTPENVNQYIGYPILFKTRTQYTVKKILSVSKSGKSIKIEEPELHNSLIILTRNIYVIVDKNPLYDSVQVAQPLKPKKNTTKKIVIVNKSDSPLYDLGQAEHPDPVYDIGQAKSASPIYDLGQAEHPDPVYDIGQAKSASPIYDLGQAKSASPLYDLAADPTGQTSTAKLDISSGSWFYYILKIVDSQPRTEKELCELMKLKFPVRLTGKTPCNTLNTMLQILVKHGYINRIAFKTKGTQKRQNYKYFKKDVPTQTDYIEIMPT